MTFPVSTSLQSQIPYRCGSSCMAQTKRPVHECALSVSGKLSAITGVMTHLHIARNVRPSLSLNTAIIWPSPEPRFRGATKFQTPDADRPFSAKHSWDIPLAGE